MKASTDLSGFLGVLMSRFRLVLSADDSVSVAKSVDLFVASAVWSACQTTIASQPNFRSNSVDVLAFDTVVAVLKGLMSKSRRVVQ